MGPDQLNESPANVIDALVILWVPLWFERRVFDEHENRVAVLLRLNISKSSNQVQEERHVEMCWERLV